jgi:macrophage erythroblast attacher
VDYLLRRGYTESAQTLAIDENLNGLTDVDIELFRDLQRIEDALRSGSATEALQWCKDNSSTLKKGKVRQPITEGKR